jgi:hypothetical protein
VLLITLLHEDVDVILGFSEIDELDDVIVMNFLPNLNFSFNPLDDVIL